jgi:RNase adaptor protein for sRNA GlmZ degradation
LFICFIYTTMILTITKSYNKNTKSYLMKMVGVAHGIKNRSIYLCQNVIVLYMSNISIITYM